MSTQTATIGMNRTGIATSPIDSQRMIDGTQEFPPDKLGDERVIGEVRGLFAREAEPIGSVPPPANLKGLVSTTVKGVQGKRPTQFIDKLGERLAFERSGVRLYEALISKYKSLGSFAGGPDLAELEHNLREEYEHFQMLTTAVTQIGGDPTVMTPSADLHATMTKGILEVMVDARTTLVQCLEALLVVELADNECWETLVELAEQSGEGAMVASFQRALAEEAQHLADVRGWIAAAQDRVVVQSRTGH